LITVLFALRCALLPISIWSFARSRA